MDPNLSAIRDQLLDVLLDTARTIGDESEESLAQARAVLNDCRAEGPRSDTR